MAVWLTVTRLATAANVLVLLGLCVVWLRNYRRLQTQFTLGFLVFGAFLLVENAYALWLFVFDPTTSTWFANIPERYNLALMVLSVLQLAALATLAWVTRQ